MYQSLRAVYDNITCHKVKLHHLKRYTKHYLPRSVINIYTHYNNWLFWILIEKIPFQGVSFFFFLWQRSYCVMKKKNTIEKRVLHWTVCIFAKTRIRFSNIKFLCRRTSPCTQSDFVGHICQTLCGPFCHFWQDLCDILRFIEHTRYYGDGFVKSDHSLFFYWELKT